MNAEAFHNSIAELLQHKEAVFHTCEVLVHDTDDNHLCTAHTTWQIKRWNKMRSK